ncbi:hypothetical protein DVH24_004167 [Malus domestica]|uniref:CRM domain-containing protein n=1 Tax=Malus domestica TaxID=3750 RepID=A0A498KCI9_MALDO|nr:hypothetical protein DVH24_004167 [Malus domestica]
MLCPSNNFIEKEHEFSSEEFTGGRNVDGQCNVDEGSATTALPAVSRVSDVVHGSGESVEMDNGAPVIAATIGKHGVMSSLSHIWMPQTREDKKFDTILHIADALSADNLEAMNVKVNNLVVLDGTWTKAKRIEVRLQSKPGFLSTVESIVYALKAVGDSPKGLDYLLDVFESMVEDQIRCKEERLSNQPNQTSLSAAMLKLLSWRPLPHKTLTLDPTKPFLSLSRLLSQSLIEDPYEYDPPFSPVSKPPKPKKTKTQDKAPDPKNDPTRPLKSDLPFDFSYSYSETNPAVKPIAFRESPKFSPFGPGRLDRKWTGTVAAVQQEVDLDRVAEEKKRVLGDPLTEEEVAELVERYRHSDCARQINMGKGGVTHNMLDDIHNHWKRAEAVRIKCLGVPTLDMDNVCFHLEDKSGGKIIYRHINVLILYRGRNYDPKNRPVIPVMLWKPYPPIYPKLVKNVADGLTFEETKELRNIGLNCLPLMKLTRNGVYVNVVDRVRETFNTEEVVRLDCTHVGTSDCKRIGVKLRDLVPCIPLLFKDEQIILWRGKRDQRQDSECTDSSKMSADA